MRIVCDYKILEFNNPRNLESAVRGYLQAGWRVAGGVTVINGFNRITRYCQAVVKMDEADESN